VSLVFLATTPLVLALFRRNGKKPDAVLSPLEKTAAAARGGLDVKVAFDDDADAEDDARDDDDDDDDDDLLFPAKRRKGGWCCFGPLILSILLLKKAALLVALLLEKIVVVVVVVVVIIAAFVRVRAFVDTTTRKRVVLYNVCEWNIFHLSIQSHFFKRTQRKKDTNPKHIKP